MIAAFMMIVTFTVTTYSPNSEAILGLIFKNKVVKVIGGIGAGTGATVGLTSLIAAHGATTLGAGLGAAIIMVYGFMFAGVGLIILDDNTIADIEFSYLDELKASQLTNISKESIDIYNQEREMLNSIRKTMISEVVESEDTADAEALWADYKHYLSPATVEVAEELSKRFIEGR